VEQEQDLRKDIDNIEFQEEYCCEFIDESLSFFPYEMIWEAQKIGVKKYIPEKTDKPIMIGVDFGKKVSETVIIVSEEVEPEKFRVIWIEPLPGVDYPEQLAVIKQFNELYDPLYINVDASGPGGQTMYDFLVKEDSLASKVWGYNFDPKFKEKIIIRTRMLMSRDRLGLPDKKLPYAETLEKQLHQVQRKTTSSGESTRYTGKIEGGNDDYVWALALSVYKEMEADVGGAYFETRQDADLKKILGSSESSMVWE
jgi:phage FluMu gp28-like protein